MKNRLGIFGGTFNPIHNGHLKMAERAKKEYKLSCVYFIPCGIPPHKLKQKLFSAKLRYSLIKKAIKGKKYFKVLDIEIKKKKPAYTIDTIRLLTKRISEKINCPISPSPHPRLFFLIGQDSFESLHTWNKPGELAKLITFLVLLRGRRNRVKIPKVKNLKWHLVHTKPINISSSNIRNRIEKRLSLNNLLTYGFFYLFTWWFSFW